MASRLRSLVGAYPQRWFLAVMLLALAVRCLAWDHAVMMTNDGPDFLWQAQQMLAGRWSVALSHHYHPFYALLIAGATPLLGDVVTAAAVVSIVAGLVAVWAVYALARRADPARPGVALAAALLIAVHGASVTHTSDVRSDGLYATLFVLTAATLLAASELGGWRWLAAGALAGSTYLTRPEGLFLVAPAALAVFACARRRGVPAGARGALAFAAGLALAAAPYVVAIHDLTGRWVLSMKPSIAAAGLGDGGATLSLPPDCPLASPVVRRLAARSNDGDADDADDAAPDDDADADADAGDDPRAATAATTTASAETQGSLARAASGTLASLRAFNSVARADILALAAIGWPWLWRRRRQLALALALTLLGWLAAAALHEGSSGYLNDRHMLAPAQLLFPLAGAGWLALWDWRRMRYVTRPLCLAVVASMALAGVKYRHADQQALLEGLAFARDHSAPAERLVVGRRKHGWYASRRVIELSLPCDERILIATMLEHDATLLVLDEEDVLRDAPQWLDGPLFERRARFGEGKQAVLVLARRG